MRSGQLNEIIEIYEPSVVINEYGEQQTEYVLKFRTRSQVLHNNGNRSIQNTEVVYDYSKTFKVRYYHNIDEFDRIKWNGHFYQINDIEPNKEIRELVINTIRVNE